MTWLLPATDQSLFVFLQCPNLVSDVQHTKFEKQGAFRWALDAQMASKARVRHQARVDGVVASTAVTCLTGTIPAVYMAGRL